MLITPNDRRHDLDDLPPSHSDDDGDAPDNVLREDSVLTDDLPDTRNIENDLPDDFDPDTVRR